MKNAEISHNPRFKAPTKSSENSRIFNSEALRRRLKALNVRQRSNELLDGGEVMALTKAMAYAQPAFLSIRGYTSKVRDAQVQDHRLL